MKKFKLNKKAVLGAALVLILLVALIVFLIIKVVDGTSNKNGVSEELVKEKTYSGLVVKNIDIQSNKNITHLMADVQNNSDKEFKAKSVKLVFKDKKGKELGKTNIFLSSIEAKGAIRIDVVIDPKYKDAYNFEIK